MKTTKLIIAFLPVCFLALTLIACNVTGLNELSPYIVVATAILMLLVYVVLILME